MKKSKNINVPKVSFEYQLYNYCTQGDLGGVKLLLKEHNVNIHANNDEAFRTACGFGRVDIVRYLLTSPELSSHADINAVDKREYTGLSLACRNGALDVVKYLLTSPELEKHADLHMGKDHAFRTACFLSKMNVVEYLVFEQKIEFSEHIKNYLSDPHYRTGNTEFYEQVERMFKIRDTQDFAEKLENELSPNKSISDDNAKKMKI